MRKKVVITVRPFGLNQEMMSKRLTEHGFDVSWNCLNETNDVNKIIEFTKGYNAVIAGGELWNQKALDEVSDSVDMITRFGSGYDKVDLQKATKLGIAVANTPFANSPTIGEHAVALMLAVLRGIPKYDRRIREDQWTVTLINQLTGKTVGLVGMGAIAIAVAKILKGFSARILAHDIKQDTALAETLGIAYVSLDELLRQSDVVSMHVPLTDKTLGMVHADFLGKMNRNAILINTSRGKVVNEKHLIAALQQGTIAGAGLDVFEEQPLTSKSPLTAMDNVVLSSHIGGMSPESYQSMLDMSIDNIIDFYAGRPNKYILNPEYSNHKKNNILT